MYCIHFNSLSSQSSVALIVHCYRHEGTPRPVTWCVRKDWYRTCTSWKRTLPTATAHSSRNARRAPDAWVTWVLQLTGVPPVQHCRHCCFKNASDGSCTRCKNLDLKNFFVSFFATKAGHESTTQNHLKNIPCCRTRCRLPFTDYNTAWTVTGYETETAHERQQLCL